MNKYFPFENKMILEAMSLINKEEIHECCKTETDIIQNYIVVYCKKYKKFFGISVSRFLKNNYASGRIINDVSDIKYSLTRLLKRRQNTDSTNTYNNLILLAYNDYVSDYKNNGFDILEKYDKFRIDSFKKLAYAVTYQKHPNIKDYIAHGYYKIVEDVFEDELDIIDEFLNIKYNDLKIDEQCKIFLKDNYLDCTWWLYVHRINEIDNITAQQLEYLYDKDIPIEELYNLIKKNKRYSATSLIDYVNRCTIFQGYEPGNVVLDLIGYISLAKTHNTKVCYYPDDLAKEKRKVYTLNRKLNDVINTDCIINYRYNYRKRMKYCFKDENYYIKAENDINNLKQTSITFVRYDITETISKSTDYFWLCDTKTNKEIALINSNNFKKLGQLEYQTKKYNDMPLSCKEKEFLNKWLVYKNNVELFLTKPQYNK